MTISRKNTYSTDNSKSSLVRVASTTTSSSSNTSITHKDTYGNPPNSRFKKILKKLRFFFLCGSTPESKKNWSANASSPNLVTKTEKPSGNSRLNISESSDKEEEETLASTISSSEGNDFETLNKIDTLATKRVKNNVQENHNFIHRNSSDIGPTGKGGGTLDKRALDSSYHERSRDRDPKPYYLIENNLSRFTQD